MKKFFKLLGFLLFTVSNSLELRFQSQTLGKFIISCRIIGLKMMGMRVGNKTRIHSYFYTNNPALIKIGNNCEIGRNAEIWAYDEVNIEDNVEIGSRLYINTSNHKFNEGNQEALSKQGSVSSQIQIGKNSWIGANVNILSGVLIEHDVVIGANSVVNKNLETKCVYAGCPARKINEIK